MALFRRVTAHRLTKIKLNTYTNTNENQQFVMLNPYQYMAKTKLMLINKNNVKINYLLELFLYTNILAFI